MKASGKVTVEVVSADDDLSLTDLVRFRDRVHPGGAADTGWSEAATKSFLTHRSPFAEGREFRILMARDNRKIVACAVAVLDQRYVRQLGERLGHIILFTALPQAGNATLRLIEEARIWLCGNGLSAVRTGFGPFEAGYAVSGEIASYHAMLQSAGFQLEKESAEYTIRVVPQLIELYEGFRRKPLAAGYQIVPVREIDPAVRANDAAAAWNESYASHWGLAPLTRAEVQALFQQTGVGSPLDFSAIAYRDGKPAGIVLVSRQQSHSKSYRWTPWKPRTKPRSTNSLSVGVTPPHRGMGLALALVSDSYLRLIAQGAKQLSYGLVLADNTSSRRVAEKLGAAADTNYVTYRMPL